ncbi:hypothetical protein N7499_010541 [Penicillium canescens]|uniref:Uncharacterized protein n=1 Tax=Penicillium canescens TaxID=5083 RepID=A0AAD6NC42_PENCN|nr:uncharacterized protein N7446_005809 [Penicillium canescens]KAJ6051178.1 hypothetical protein N7460_001712 [Penicillium canescens]KAJ6061689.1 hypothetical protein N7446_005809 [Penicillium canescens]KAJ6064937.1 hypothetical protein N7444_000590 [Penicillium canescens]KAJ6068654.1 hypothetical protein N7499_010541 [Penicillium canescens]KAJ6183293.1 hypothetical protein N7485_001935 [Penicillium canescens]
MAMDEVPYRSPVPLAFELVQHVGIFFEENLHTQALSLLYNTLASGTVSSAKAVIPQPQHLAVAATILVHPSTTTRAKSTEEKEAANASLRLLRLTNSLVGPIDAKFNVAFAFTHFESSRQGLRRQDSPETSELKNSDTKPIKTVISDADSVWQRAEDFWHVVGWAFRCSVLYPERWERWQIWLQFMCNVLEDDWKERERKWLEAKGDGREASQDAEPATKGTRGGKQAAEDDLDIFRESLIFQYISSNTTSGRNRRILRAIFADGTREEFKEVYRKKEITKTSKATQNSKKREVEVNIDKNEYGDYLDESGEESNDAPDTISPPSKAKAKETRSRRAKRTRRGTKTDLDQSTAASPISQIQKTTHVQEPGSDLSSLGGYDSLSLRQQLLSILSSVSTRLPEDFIPLDDLYHMFVENIRGLPLPIFQHFISPSILPHMIPAAQTTLCELLLFVMRESSAPRSDDDCLHQEKLEKCFLPYAAANPSIENNAKVSILLEALMALLHKSGMLFVTPRLREAVKVGVLKRGKRAEEERRRCLASGERVSVECCYLRESGLRLLFMVEHLLPIAS